MGEIFQLSAPPDLSNAKVTLLTCAVHRPEAWALCEKYWARQTRKYDQWIVLDDDEPRTVCTLGQEYFHVPQCRGHGSLAKKVKFALDHKLIKGDVLVFAENDDWVGANYLETALQRLRGLDIVGEGQALYYNVRERWWYQHSNIQHASLCATVITSRVYPLLHRIVNTSADPYLDNKIWALRTMRRKVFPAPSKKTVVGIKAMPGMLGYGNGHGERDKAARDDLTLAQLTSWIGDDAQNYAPFWKETRQAAPVVAPVFQTVGEHGHAANWSKWLGHLRDTPAVGIELGTFRGESAAWMMENIFIHPDSRYHCVDPFQGSPEHKLGAIDCTTCEADTRARLEKFGSRVTIWKWPSHARLHQFYRYPDPETNKFIEFDFIYCDALHTSQAVLRDGVLGFDVLKVGGIMIFDDYEWHVMPEALDLPKTAVDAFLACYARQIEVISVGYQVAIRKISE